MSGERSDVQTALETLRNVLPSAMCGQWGKDSAFAALATVEQELTDKKHDALVEEAWEDRGALAQAEAEVARLTEERDDYSLRMSRQALTIKPGRPLELSPGRPTDPHPPGARTSRESLFLAAV